MSEDENLLPKHLWKNIKTQRDSHGQDQSLHQPHLPHAAHSLDEAFEEARPNSQNRILHEAEVTRAIQEANEQEIPQSADPPTELIHPRGKPNSEDPVKEQQAFLNRDSEVEEILEFPEMPISYQDSQCEDLAMAQHAWLTMKNLASVRDKLLGELALVRYEFRALFESLRQENSSYLSFVAEKCSGIQQRVLEEQRALEEHQLGNPEVGEGKPGRWKEELEEKERVIEALQRENKQLQEQTLSQEHKIKEDQSLELEIKVSEQERAISFLKRQLADLREENESLSEAVFDYSQRIAQLDLEFEMRLSEQVQRQAEEQKRSRQEQEKMAEERDKYIRDMASLEQEIQKMSQNYSQQEEEFHFLKEQLVFKDEEIKCREQDLQRELSELSHKQLEVNNSLENLRRREYEIQTLDQQLRKREQDIDERNRQLIQREIETINISSQQLRDNGRDFLIRQGKTLKTEQIENSIAQGHHLPAQQHRLSPYNQYQHTGAYRTNSRSGEKDRKYEVSNSLSRQYKGNFKASGAVANGSGISKQNYPKGKTNVDSSRLHNLGSKLERLREEIRKEIRDVV